RTGGADRCQVAQGRHGRRRVGEVGMRKQLVGWAFLLPVVAYLVVCYAYPLLTNVDLSIRDYTVRTFVHGGAPLVGFDNYAKVFADPTFGTALLNTSLFTAVSLVFQYGIGLALAVFFLRSFRLSTTLRALFLVPWLLPLIVSASTWAWMLNSEAGVVNAVLGVFGVDNVHWLTSPQWSLVAVTVANIWIGIPFNLVVLHSGLRDIPAEVAKRATGDLVMFVRATRHHRELANDLRNG
ncbi:carbohydrate ABC transporter permease, partial [Kibdelosporangium lantanae]